MGSETNITYIIIGGRKLAVGDVRSQDFAAIEDPKASVVSLQSTLVQILHKLQGASK